MNFLGSAISLNLMFAPHFGSHLSLIEAKSGGKGRKSNTKLFASFMPTTEITELTKRVDQ